MADQFIHEIEDAIKQDRLEKFWRDYGSYIIAAAVLTVLLTALLTGWRSWNEKVNIRQTGAIVQALEASDVKEELSRIEESLRPGHRVIAGLTSAGLMLEEGKKEEALRYYQDVAYDKDIDPVFRDLALLLAVRLESGMVDDGGDVSRAQSFLQALQPLWKGQKNIWRYHAHMQAALILAHDLNDYAQAQEHLAVILTASDLDVPRSLIERARALDHVYGLQKEKSDTALLKEGTEG